MPIYEYDCQECGRHAEVLVRGQETIHCPACAGTNLQRTLSTFAVATGGRTLDSGPAACGRCGDPRGPGACSM